MKIFISGKITGEPIYKCMEKFDRAVINVLMDNIKVDENLFIINPLKLEGIHFGISHDKAMEICLAALKTCTHAYFLKDWKDSEGAKIEHQFCIDNGIEIIYE